MASERGLGTAPPEPPVPTPGSRTPLFRDLPAGSRAGLNKPWELARFPVRLDFDLGRYQTGPISKFKIKFKKK